MVVSGWSTFDIGFFMFNKFRFLYSATVKFLAVLVEMELKST